MPSPYESIALRLFILYIFASLSIIGFSQKRSALKRYNQAQESKSMTEAERLYLEAISKDAHFIKAYSALAHLYHNTQQNAAEAQTLQKGIANNYGDTKGFKLRLARAAYLAGDYDLAQASINRISPLPKTLEHLQACITFAIDAVNNANEYQPQNLGSAVNTQYDDYWPYISVDGQEITTTVLIEKDSTSIFFANEDLYKSKKTAQGWSKSQAVSPIINSPKNEGAQCLSADGRTLLFTACNRSTGIGSCDIYISYQRHGIWSPPKALPEPINSPYWDGHPSLSADGQYLYFASDRKFGLGKRDLYRAKLNIQGDHINVIDVQHLGANINSKEDEVSPFIHPDGKSLYFSSNGHVGLGRMDIYKTEITHDFSAPIINLGYPINTHNDEIGFVVNTQGETAYFASEREGSRKKDIYTFTLDQTLRPQASTYFRARIFDAESRKRINGKVELRNLSNQQIYYQHQHINELVVPILCSESYAINIEKNGYFFYSYQFSPEQRDQTPLVKDIYLKPIKTNSTFTLHNILFAFNTAQLDTSFHYELDRTAQLILDNPELHFQIEGHTDSIGSKTYNQELSEARALAVQNYLIRHGVPASRLSHKGYGSSHPISESPAENRRTEVRIILPQEQKQ